MPLKLSGSGGGFVSKGSNGGFRLKIVSASPAPETPIVSSGLILHLDAGNPASYPGSGTTWTDLSGQGNHATLTNGPTFDSGNGGSIVFSGTFQHCIVNTSSFPAGTAASTMSCWAKRSSAASGFKGIFSYGNDLVGAARFLGTDDSTYVFGGYGVSLNQEVTTLGVVTNTWFNITGIYNGTAASMYINGTLVSGPTSKTWNTQVLRAFIGSQIQNAQRWQGNIAQVLMYNRVLTPVEVLQNFNTDKSRFGL